MVSQSLQQTGNDSYRYVCAGCSVLHVSWLALALERVFVHTEAKSIVHWGVSEALSLDLASSPFLLPPHWQVRSHDHSRDIQLPYLLPPSLCWVLY